MGTKSYGVKAWKRHSLRCSDGGTGFQTAAITDDTEAADTETDEVSVQGLIEQASRYFNQGQDALRTGDWTEYGRYQRLLEETLRQLERNVR